MQPPPSEGDHAAGPVTRARGHRLWRGVLAIAAVTLAMQLGCTRGDEREDTSKAEQGRPVTTITARAVTLRDTVTGVGSLLAAEQIEIRAEVGGLVRKILFEEGQRVAQDELLFQLDDDELQRQLAASKAALEAAQADLTNARWNYERMRGLREDGVAAIEEFKQARDRYNALSSRVDRLSAELELVQEKIEDTRVRAPSSGGMSRHFVDVGDFVDIGDALATLYRSDPVELAFWLPEAYAGQLAVGQRVTATSPAYPDEKLTGTLSFVSPAVDRQTRKLRVKGQFRNPEGVLKPGVFATARVTLAEYTDLPVIPEACLVSTRAGHSVFVVEEGVAHIRDVEIGLRKPGRVQIRAGLASGAQVVRTGHMRLTDGAAVRVVDADSEFASDTRPASQPTTTGATAPREDGAG